MSSFWGSQLGILLCPSWKKGSTNSTRRHEEDRPDFSAWPPALEILAESSLSHQQTFNSRASWGPLPPS